MKTSDIEALPLPDQGVIEGEQAEGRKESDQSKLLDRGVRKDAKHYEAAEVLLGGDGLSQSPAHSFPPTSFTHT